MHWVASLSLSLSLSQDTIAHPLSTDVSSMLVQPALFYNPSHVQRGCHGINEHLNFSKGIIKSALNVTWPICSSCLHSREILQLLRVPFCSVRFTTVRPCLRIFFQFSIGETIENIWRHCFYSHRCFILNLWGFVHMGERQITRDFIKSYSIKIYLKLYLTRATNGQSMSIEHPIFSKVCPSIQETECPKSSLKMKFRRRW